MNTTHLRLVANSVYVPPPPIDYELLPEVRPQPIRISRFFAFWIGFAWGGCAVGMTVALMMR